MREKLIDVFCAVFGEEPDYQNEEANKFVDELIANGVTVTDNNVGSKWIPVTEPPKKKGCYLVTVRHWCDGKPVTREAYYTCSGWISCERGQDITERVMYWMPLPLPQPPKGE